jgi:hypothetical protein
MLAGMLAGTPLTNSSSSLPVHDQWWRFEGVRLLLLSQCCLRKQHKRSVSRSRSSKQSAEQDKSDIEVTCDASVKGDDKSDVESQASLEKHYVPLMELFRGYWSGLLLQMGYEACKYCSPARQVLYDMVQSCILWMFGRSSWLMKRMQS